MRSRMRTMQATGIRSNAEGRHRALIRWSVAATALVIALIAGAGVAVYAAATSSVGTGPGGCFDPRDFHAVPDDGSVDGPQIQAAIDAAVNAGGGTVCLG